MISAALELLELASALTRCSPIWAPADEADEGADDAQQQTPLVEGLGEPAWPLRDRHGCHVQSSLVTHSRHSSHVPYAAGAGS